jgi:hypothetical protein
VRWGQLRLPSVAHFTLPGPAGQARGLAAYAAPGPSLSPRKRAERAIFDWDGAAEIV